jgi:hypothetical protein
LEETEEIQLCSKVVHTTLWHRHLPRASLVSSRTVQTSSGPKRKTIYGKTYAEVRAKLAKAIGERDAGLIFDSEDLTVAEYLAR